MTDGRAAPNGIVFDAYTGWVKGAVQMTPPVPGVVSVPVDGVGFGASLLAALGAIGSPLGCAPFIQEGGHYGRAQGASE